MGLIYLNGEEIFQDEKALSLLSDDDKEENDYSSVDALEFKAEFKKIFNKHHLIVDLKQAKNNHRCNQQSCQCGNKLTTSDYISFVGVNKNLMQCSISLAGYSASNFLGYVCRATSIFGIPVNLYSTGIFIKNLNRRRRTSATSLGDFIVEYASAAGPVDIIISTSGQWMFGLMERTVEARTFVKSSLIFQLVTIDIDSTKCRIRERKSNAGQMKFLATSPSGLCNTSPQDHEVKSASSEDARSELKVSEKVLASYSSTNSTCLYQSTSTFMHSTVSKGLLHCMWKGETPYFVFSMGDDCSEVYVANPIKIESSVDKALDYMYLFCSRTGSKKEFINYSDNASDFVGNMKVSSSLVLNSNRSKVMETEFVLFGAGKNHSKEIQSPASTPLKSRGLPKKVVDIFRPNNSFKHKSNCSVGEPSFRIEDFLEGPCLSELSNLDKTGLTSHLENDFLPNLELAAIVVKDNRHDNNEAAVGGWGLKFLEKITVDHVNTSLDPSFSCHNSEGKGSRGESAKSINVLVPAGFHGGPTTTTGGPSSLIKRWRSGGHCDCAGWDIGCPLTVLNNSSIVSEAFPHKESEEDCKSVNLFLQGAKHGEPTLKMVNMNEGIYSVYFHSTLSALQSFSIGVAIIHSQTSTLYPKL